MKTTAQQIEVMQAYLNGMQIQFKYQDKEWENIDMSKEVEWNWSDFDYRVAPSKQYIPYLNDSEVLEDMKIHGPMVRENEYTALVSIRVLGDYYFVPGYEEFRSVEFKDAWINGWKWQDGTLFGKYVEK